MTPSSERKTEREYKALRAQCPACTAQRVHTESEVKRFHPLARHGFNGVDWTHPDAEAASKADAADAKAWAAAR